MNNTPFMMQLGKLISLRNLLEARRRAKAHGQIATLLLLVVVAVLIFALMTANLGQMSLTATRMANAADSSALLLGSQLATKSRALYESLGNTTKKCIKVKGGFLGMLFAMILAIVMQFIPGLQGWTLVLVSALAGAVGGAIGAGIEGGNVLMGAIQGAVAGAALGMGVGQGLEFGAGFAGPGGATVEVGAGAASVGTSEIAAMSGAVVSDVAPIASGGVMEVGAFGSVSAATTGMATGASVLAGATPVIVGSTLATAGAMATGAFSVASSLYTAAVMDQMKADAIAAVGKALSGVPEYSRFRETVFFEALAKTVDDPNRVPDTNDSDGDLDFTEKVPAFQVWWKDRTNGIIATIPPLTALTQAFLNGPLATMDADAKAANDDTPGPLFRKEIEGSDGQGLEGVDGSIVEFVRTLKESFNLPVSFWEPGPSGPDLAAWHALDCETCAAPAGFDEIDFTIDTFQDLVAIVSGEDDGYQDDSDGLRERPLDQVVGTWKTWIKFFYDPDPANDEDFYDVFGAIVNGGVGLAGMDSVSPPGWKQQIETIRQGLPVCAINPGWWDCDANGNCWFIPPSVANPPCKGDGTEIPVSGGSIDSDTGDEFSAVKAEIDTLKGKLESFRSASKKFFEDMTAAETLNLGGGCTGSGGVNPVTYCWVDSRGVHSVMVTVGPFRIAYIRKKTSGGLFKKKICFILTDYSDGGSNSWVSITRNDPVKATRFWTWNPHGGVVTKLSRVKYSYDNLEIAGIH